MMNVQRGKPASMKSFTSANTLFLLVPEGMYTGSSKKNNNNQTFLNFLSYFLFSYFLGWGVWRVGVEIFYLSFPDFVMIQQNVLCQTQQLVKCCNRKICSL